MSKSEEINTQPKHMAVGDDPISYDEIRSLEIKESEILGTADRMTMGESKTPKKKKRRTFFYSLFKASFIKTESDGKSDLDSPDILKESEKQKRKFQFLSVLDREFPLVPIKPTHPHQDGARILFLFTSTFFFFFVTSVKFFIVRRFDLATFCDIRDWADFNDKVKRNVITTIDPVDCFEKCSHFHNILLTKVFQLNFNILYCVNCYYAAVFVLQRKLKRWILTILAYGTLPTLMIGHVIFWQRKSFAYFVGNFLYVMLCPVIIKQSWLYFKMYCILVLILSYFTLIKTFFEMIFPMLLTRDNELTLQLTPVILFVIKFIGFQVLKIPYFIRYSVISKTMIIQFFILFEFVSIGTFHSLINTSGFGSYILWLNIIQSIVMEFISVAYLPEKFFNFLINKFYYKKKVRHLDLQNFTSLYYGMKIELEIFSILIYFLLISTQYFDYCMGTLVDCMGRPTVSMSPIKNEHFYLVLVLLGATIIQEIFMFLLEKYSSIRFCKIFMKIDSFEENIFYVCMLFGITINFGIPGLYSMMYQSEE